jgi:hypothetical protein
MRRIAGDEDARMAKSSYAPGSIRPPYHVIVSTAATTSPSSVQIGTRSLRIVTLLRQPESGRSLTDRIAGLRRLPGGSMVKSSHARAPSTFRTVCTAHV